MKKLFQLLAIALTATVIGGCVKEKDMQRDVPMFTITVTGEDVKAGFTPDSDPSVGTLHLAWQAGDQIRVFNHANPAQNAVYTIKDGFTDKTAQFEGPAINADYYDILAPADFEHPDDPAAGNPNLTQNGNGTTDHLTFTAKLENVAKADLADIVFNSNWAADHSATLKKGAIVKFILTLPNAITAPRRVVLEELNSNQLAEDRVSVNIENVSTTSDHVITAYAQAGWEDISLAGRSYVTVGVEDGDGTYYTLRHRLANKVVTFTAGKVNRFQMGTSTLGTDGNDVWIEQLFAGGDGTEGNPYLISNAKHLDNIHVIETRFVNKESGYTDRTFHFRLINDIDMQSYLTTNSWVPINMLNPYEFEVDLDGDGHIIDYFSINSLASGSNQTTGFFGVLYGSVHDLVFMNASVQNSKGNMTGILCAYCGYKAKPAHVYNVHVNGSVRYTASGNAGVGGLAGVVYNCLLESSSAFNIDVLSSKNYNGGLFGRDDNSGCTIRNCFTSGQVGSTSNSTQRIGGICGGLIKQHTTIINCYSTAKVLGTYCMGGIAGHCNLDKNSNDPANANHPTNTSPYNVIQGCIAWNDEITSHATDPDADHYSSGTIVGYGSTHNYLTNCGYKSSISFTDYRDWHPYTQDDASPSTELVVNSYSNFKYHYPYHGKYAFTGTLPQAAKSLGWNETVWDLSGSMPLLTGEVEPVPASGASSVPAGTSGAPKYPSNGGNWHVETIDDGIMYYHYHNTSDATYTESQRSGCNWHSGGNTHVNAFVVDVDLNNTDYEVKLVYTSTGIPCSEIFRKMGAYAAINASYELGSIALKANSYYNLTTAPVAQSTGKYSAGEGTVTNYVSGYPVSYMPNNTIGDSGVENWKSQGTLYCDGSRGVRLAFDGYDSSKNPPVKTPLEERLFYQLCTDDEPGLLSSSPVLIENFNRVGSRFNGSWYTGTASQLYTGYNAESPYMHQRALYSRTAVALTSDNHLLLFVCDGKYPNATGGTGMSAGWVTKFLGDNFNPQFALNLDGGGSTTMCVANTTEGDSDTHVVNYPSDNYTGKYKYSNGDNSYTLSNKYDHYGERTRNSFLVIVPSGS